jgi:hypothetical protein
VLALAFTHCREVMKSVGRLWREVSIIHAIVDHPWTGLWLALLFILLLCFICLFFFFDPLFSVLEFSVAGWRSVNLTLPFLNHENGDFWILMRDISYLKILSSWRFCNSEVSLWTLLCYCCWFQGLFAELICSH